MGLVLWVPGFLACSAHDFLLTSPLGRETIRHMLSANRRNYIHIVHRPSCSGGGDFTKRVLGIHCVTHSQASRRGREVYSTHRNQAWTVISKPHGSTEQAATHAITFVSTIHSARFTQREIWRWYKGQLILNLGRRSQDIWCIEFGSSSTNAPKSAYKRMLSLDSSSVGSIVNLK